MVMVVVSGGGSGDDAVVQFFLSFCEVEQAGLMGRFVPNLAPENKFPVASRQGSSCAL